MSGTPYLAGSAGTAPGTSSAALIGCTIYPSATETTAGCMTNWNNLVTPAKWRKEFLTGFPTVPSAYVQEAVALGIGVVFVYKPTFSGTTNDVTWTGGADKPTAGQIASDQSAMVASLGSIAGGLPTFKVAMWQNPTSAGGPSSDQYTYLYYKNYSALHAVCPVVSIMDGLTPSSAATYFPGPTSGNPGATLYCDELGVNYYANHYVSGTHLSSWTTVADFASVRFGITEMGNSNIATVTTQAQVVPYLSIKGNNQYAGDATNSIQAVMQARQLAAKPNSMCAWYQNDAGTGASGLQNVISNATDYRISYLQAINSSINALALQSSLTTSIAQGDTIYVATFGSAYTVGSISDTQGNNYTLLGTQALPSGGTMQLFSGYAAAGLVAGTDTVTATYNNGPTAQAILIVGDNGVQQPNDVLVTKSGTGTVPNPGSTGVLSSPEEHVINFIADLFAGGVPTGSTFTTLGNQAAGTVAYLSATYKDVTATTALTPTWTTASAPWADIIVSTPDVPLSTAYICAGGVSGEVYSATLEAIGGVGAYTWSVTSGSLPTGLTLASGAISGTPTAAGTFNFTLTVTDAHSVSAASPQSITILPGGPLGAPALPIPGNILTVADSDFEQGSGTFTWAAETNSSGVGVSNKISLTGGQSYKWTITADGTSQISSGFYPCTAGLPYVASLWLLPSGARNCYAGIEWWTSASGGTLLGTTYGPVAASSTNSWQSLNVAGFASPGATVMRLVGQVNGGNAGERVHIDTAYLGQSNVQVLVDWANNLYASAGASGQQFMNVSPWVRMDQGINMQRGRQNAISEIQAGTGSLVLQNDNGLFTRYNLTSPIFLLGDDVTSQRRCQINIADESGLFHTRWDGMTGDITYGFDNTGNTSTATVMLTDVLAYLARQDPLRCWTKEHVLSLEPLLHWTLDDTGKINFGGVATESSGNNGPALRIFQVGSVSGAAIAFQDTSGGVETLADAAEPGAPDGSAYWVPGSNQPSSSARGLVSGIVGPYTGPLPSVNFTPHLAAGSAQNTYGTNTGYQLNARISPITPNAVGNDYTFETWFMENPFLQANTGGMYGPFIVLSLGNSHNQSCLVAGAFLPNQFKVGTYSQPPAFAQRNFTGASVPSFVSSVSTTISTWDTVARPHHLVILIKGDPVTPVVQVYLDGVAYGSTFNLPNGQQYDTIVIGGAYGGYGNWYGNISCASVYNYLLPISQIQAHTQIGQYGMWESTTDDCVATLVTFTDIPGFWNNVSGNHYGLTMTEYQDITGLNALSAIQIYEQAERGLLFVSANGTLNFQTRDQRMGEGPPGLYLPPDTFDADLSYSNTDLYQINEQAATSTIFNSGGTFTYVTGSTFTLDAPGTTTGGAAYINTSSQSKYGAYATNPITQPIQLPLISWSRAYMQLGIPSYGLWNDPDLQDYCSWVANSRAEPWLFPGQIVVDVLSIDPQAGLALSDFYGIEIGSVVAPSGTLPTSFPSANLSTEWIIEGVNETITQNSHVLQFYTSPMEPQRAWLPGDPVYGQLDNTARIGVSAADTSIPQADGKDVSHDAGPPYWPPAFQPNMNNPAGDGDSFIGGTEIRGFTQPLANALNPPIAVMGVVNQAQSMPSGGNVTPQVFWDTVYVDTAGGLSAAGWPNWYVVLVPGWYEVDAQCVWSRVATSGGNVGQAWIVIAQAAAQGLAAGVSNPDTVNQYICPIGEGQRRNTVGINTICSPGSRVYLGLGDMITLAAQQDTGSAWILGTNYSGSSLSIRYIGMGTQDDRVQVNSAIGNGGVVTNPSKYGTGATSFGCQHSYCYYGATASGQNYALRSTDLQMYQGCAQGQINVTGSQFGQVQFPVAAIRTFLAGKTITGLQLKCTNVGASYSYADLIVGYYVDTSGGARWVPGSNSANNRDMFRESFNRGQVKTFTLPLAIATALNSTANGLFIGDDNQTGLGFNGWWQGGPGNWILTFFWKQ